MRLLRIDGTVLVSPARVLSDATPRRERVDESDGVGRTKGAELAEAARLLRENDEVLGRRTRPEVR